MSLRAWAWLPGLLLPMLKAQQPCAPTPLYDPCEITVEIPAAEAAKHPNPYLTIDLQAEMRSPKYKTYLVPAFWDGGRRLVIRFAPDEPGRWTYRLNSNLDGVDGTVQTFEAKESDAPGFIRPANMYHWRYTESLKAHLWMGDTMYRFASLERPAFDQWVGDRAAQKFTHLRGTILPGDGLATKAFPSADQPNPEYFRELDARLRSMNQKGLIADLVLSGDKNQLASLFPTYAQREKFIRFVAAHFASFNVTWQIARNFENYDDGRDVMKQLGLLLKKYDYYGHPRSTGSTATSTSMLPDGWVTHALHDSVDPAVGAVEHQVYTVPFVATVSTGAGSAAFRSRLWNYTMNGDYPSSTPDGTLDAAGIKAMTGWFELMSRTRWWDLYPYFDLEGGKALANPGVEYLVYLEKPGPVQVTIEKHEYQVYWMDPASGEITKEKKDFKGELYEGSPPGNTHDWVLHLSRDGRKEGMAKSYRFESWPLPVQEVEVAPAKVPYELTAPPNHELATGKPVPYSIKLKRETRATKAMQFVLLGEVVRDAQGLRVLATGKEGTFTISPSLAKKYPATLSLRVYGLNGAGKLYAQDSLFQLKAE